jgi:SAM-dependent methyltransferase
VSRLAFNKLCEIEDFEDPELSAVMRDVFAYRVTEKSPDYPVGLEHRKDWEIAMAVRTLSQYGALKPEAKLLGVGAGREDTIFYLTGHANQVFATDRYLSPEIWQNLAPQIMLAEPQSVAPYPFDIERLVVQHMDGRCLRYPDGTFDGIFSSGSIEHFGDLQDVAFAAYEMGRVLKPGGILSISTEFRLSGPDGGIGWPGSTLLLSKEHLLRYVVEASGLEPVDELVTSISDKTLSHPRALADLIAAAAQEDFDLYADRRACELPTLVLVHEDYVFGSVHLALRKTDGYPVRPNEWARPTQFVRRAISDYNRLAASAPEKAKGDRDPAGSDVDDPLIPAGGKAPDHLALLEEFHNQLVDQLSLIDAGLTKVEELDRGSLEAGAEVSRHLVEVLRLQDELDGQLAQGSAGELGILRAQYERLERALVNTRKECESIRASLASSSSTVDRIESHIQVFHKYFQQVKSESSQLQAELVERHAQLTKLQSKLDELSPLSFGIARRLTGMARRFPAPARALKVLLVNGIKLRRIARRNSRSN